jgi:perosamine synthetase
MKTVVRPSAPITMARSYFPPEDIRIFQRESESILQGRVSMGRWVEKFQTTAAAAHNTRHAFAVNSCTSALEVSLLACGILPGDRVIVPVQTFIATGMAIHNVGAIPVFADIRRESLCLDPEELLRLRAERVKAVILVHFGGLISPDVLLIQEICRDRGWSLIEDAAHAHAAKFQGLGAGSFGNAACFSYYPTKVITTGEGGMIVTNDEQVAAVCRSHQFRGQDLSLPGEQFVRPFGRNIRFPELSALLGVLQYARLEEFVRARRAVAATYDQALEQEPTILRPLLHPDCFHNYWLYTIILPPGVNRAAIRSFCKEEWQIDVEWSYFPPMHLMPAFRNLYGTAPGMLPVAEDVLTRIVCLPIHPLISPADAERVVECFLHAYREQAARDGVRTAG